jgi:hypothetical protein
MNEIKLHEISAILSIPSLITDEVVEVDDDEVVEVDDDEVVEVDDEIQIQKKTQ